jgi:hypothetical protein
MTKLISKSLFLNFLSCKTLYWFELNSDKKQILTEAEKLRIEEGLEIGEFARSIYPEGILIEAKNLELAAKQTQIHMNDAQVEVLFEATFIADGFVTKADILVREKEGWKLIEVKSSLHDDLKASSDHIDDLAYTTFVSKASGLNIKSIELMRLSKDYRLGDSTENLFKTIDCKAEVEIRAGEFRDIADKVTEIVSQPKAILNTACKKCDYFKDICVGKNLVHPITEIPRINEKKLNVLVENEILEITDLPEDFSLTTSQQRVVEAIRTNSPIIDKEGIKKAFSKLRYPYYFLDFEAILTALPIYPNIAPHQVVLTQYSLHILESENSELKHFEFLAPHQKDSRRELIESLLENLSDKGSIFVYSNYEETQLKSLSKEFPDLKQKIESILKRLFDLNDIFKEFYIHPEFCGKTSIKKVLPVLVPELSYKDLDIGGGDTAVAMFVKMVKGKCSEEEITKIRLDLLKYCHLDTLAMVRLHGVVTEIAC